MHICLEPGPEAALGDHPAPLLKLQLRLTAYQNHGPNVFVANGPCERVNHGLAIRRPAQSDRVEYIPFGRETKVFCRIVASSVS